MIIRKVTLNPFGGISNRTLSFKPGLNVVLGPNEAGKSTLVDAVFAALFLKSAIKKSSREWNDFLLKYLPYPKGESLRVELHFTGRDGRDYVLLRGWGSAKEASLAHGTNKTMDDDEIQEHLRTQLGYDRGTYQGILFARQDEMVRTIDLLRQNQEAAGTMGDLLRSFVLQSGGVSLEKLQSKIETLEKQLLNNWDQDLDLPRNNKGIDNPHKKNIGQILQAYYDTEHLKRKHREVREAEEEIQRLQDELQALLQQKEELQPRREQMAAIEKDIRQREITAYQLQNLSTQLQTVKKLVTDWPTATERKKALAKEHDQLQTKHILLQQELTEAQQTLLARQKRELYTNVKPLVQQIEEKEAELSRFPNIEADDVRTLERLENSINQKKAELAAMKLQAKMSAAKPLTLTVTKGPGEPEQVTVHKETVITADGRLLFAGKDWSLEVQSGEEGVDRIIAQLKEHEENLASGLTSHNATDLNDVRSIQQKRAALISEIQQTRTKAETMLNEYSFADLEAELKELGPDKPVRDPEKIREEISETLISQSTTKTQLDELTDKITAWEEEFGSTDKVIETLGEISSSVRQKQTELDNLAPLPEGYSDPAHFLAELDRIKEDLEKVTQSINDHKLHLQQAELTASDESTDEINEKLKASEEKLLNLKKQATALLQVKEELQKLRDNADRDSFRPLTDAFGRYLKPVTANRYCTSDMDGVLPNSIATCTGKELPVDILSMGTKRGMALAIRLAMAEFLLKDAAGFMVMDDPLVDLDPQRRELAAATIREYAEKRQLIVLTCDPAVAQLLAGNLVEIEGSL
ncbi:MAG: SMC family ATPase [Bacillota bacterium]|nr:SMC family ATPase [Bacillota bacterium]MDW7684776.1 SMC family ATPase [Bacillota bacterium]